MKTGPESDRGRSLATTPSSVPSGVPDGAQWTSSVRRCPVVLGGDRQTRSGRRRSVGGLRQAMPDDALWAGFIAVLVGRRPSGRVRQAVEQGVPLSVKLVGLPFEPLQLPWKPNEVLPPGGIEPLYDRFRAVTDDPFWVTSAFQAEVTC